MGLSFYALTFFHEEIKIKSFLRKKRYLDLKIKCFYLANFEQKCLFLTLILRDKLTA